MRTHNLDPHSFFLSPLLFSWDGDLNLELDLDTNFNKEKRKKVGRPLITASFFFLRKSLKFRCFLIYNNFLCLFRLLKTQVFFSILLRFRPTWIWIQIPESGSDKDPYQKIKLMDPDPHKMNADPQPGSTRIFSPSSHLESLSLGKTTLIFLKRTFYKNSLFIYFYFTA